MTVRNGLSPNVVLSCAAAGLAAFLLTRSDIAGSFCCVAAYGIALLSCWRVAAQYPAGSPIRLAWIAMIGNCLLSAFRHIALNPALESTIGSQDRVYLLSQALQLPALLCALLGLGGMWWGMYRL